MGKRFQRPRKSARTVADVERALGSLRALRQKFPADLFVHLRYQDAVFEAGTEGHLKAMLREYQNLAADHAGEILHEYLAGRAHLPHVWVDLEDDDELLRTFFTS